MARHPRLVVAGVALHVRQRGNDGQDCFGDDNDRLVYLALLREALRRYACAMHAYCLMSNHVHLLVTPETERACALVMRDVGRGYAAYFNRRYDRWGALWEHPFRSCLVDSAAYVITCYRYIDRNPVEANVVEQPSAYAWSSFAGNIGLREDPLLTPHAEYIALGAEQSVRRRTYAHLCHQPLEENQLRQMREATAGGLPLVGERLKAALEKAGARLARGKAGRRAHAAGGDAANYVLSTEFE